MYLEDNGHELVVTSSKDGDDCEVEKHLHDAEIVISQPFWPCCTCRAVRTAVTPEECQNAKV